ncbi:MAG: flagellar filament capping protein FliD, partial [Acetatifactor sp.]|nr:flagellar filament capping protein FliD [Acetatifactor sp.]
SRTELYLSQYKSLTASRDAAQKTIDEINKKYADQGITLGTAESYNTLIEAKNKEIAELNEKLNAADSPLTEADREAAEKRIADLQEEVKDLSEKKADAESLAANQESVTKLNDQIDEIAGANGYITVTTGTDADGETTYTAAATSKLTGEVEDRYYAKAEKAHKVIEDYNNSSAAGNSTTQAGMAATKVSGQNAEITLNGATYTNSNNTFEINGLTFTALAETKDGEPITVTTEQDVDGIYGMVKDFLKEYNSIINEMDKLYNADAARGYEPLSDEEKDVMSESDIEKYEQKIKDSLLRRDENLSTVSSAMKSVMSAGIEVGGKTMYLFDFGIDTLSYFTAPDNEKNSYHIAGDADDGYTSGEDDKLKTMIANNPDTVIDFFT